MIRSKWHDAQPSVADQNLFLKSHSWEEYGSWHLGLKVGATDETKNRYAFVFGDLRRLHRSGLIACYYRAAEYDHNKSSWRLTNYCNSSTKSAVIRLRTARKSDGEPSSSPLVSELMRANTEIRQGGDFKVDKTYTNTQTVLGGFWYVGKTRLHRRALPAWPKVSVHHHDPVARVVRGRTRFA